MGFDIAEAGIQAEVLDHQHVRVQPDPAESMAASLIFGERQEPPSITLSLGLWRRQGYLHRGNGNMTSAERMACKAAQQAHIEAVMMERYDFVLTAEPQFERMPDGSRREHQVAFIEGADTRFSTAYAPGSSS
jgi:hypothetical protein